MAEDTWTREAAKWDHLAGLRVVPVLGDQKHRLAALASAGDIYVINRENVQWLVETCGKRWDFDAIIIDELSSFKSPKAKRWRCLKRVAKLARIVWGLTAPPAASLREWLCSLGMSRSYIARTANTKTHGQNQKYVIGSGVA